MKLPNSLKDAQWAKEYLSKLEKMNDNDLFDEVFDAQNPDFNSIFSTRKWWIAQIAKDYLRERFLIGKKQ